jgi:hypothetical protein
MRFGQTKVSSASMALTSWAIFPLNDLADGWKDVLPKAISATEAVFVAGELRWLAGEGRLRAVFGHAELLRGLVGCGAERAAV